MSGKKDGAAIVGLGAAACAVCCAVPILGLLAAIGLGTIVGVALFGSIALVAAVIVGPVLYRRRQRRTTARSPGRETVSLDLPTARTWR